MLDPEYQAVHTRKSRMREHGGHTEKGYSFIQIILGVIMLVIGMKYLPSSAEGYYTEETTGPPVVKERDPCPNGAAYYLYIGGICILVANLVNVVSKVSQVMAEGMGLSHAVRGVAYGCWVLPLVSWLWWT
eukprot:TRINITY_DN3675_c0_g2_i1.p2 TRINITY_DN3675_c0_g2~~TRINITY_DN3675_c0_g2_i1.p2  ORF type:complete len:131 (-),score=30.48 TRINITY_DN3675_c0_g2_i1:328-720(-)